MQLTIAGSIDVLIALRNPINMVIHKIYFRLYRGGVHTDLEKLLANISASKAAVGNAIGGLSVGEPIDKMYEICSLCCDHLPMDKPRYLMGVGTPWNILEAIEMGVDMFDCVMPTRNGRNAMLFTSNGIINIDNKNGKKIFRRLIPA
jgi:queuine tRNA-ribosyltransferase